HRAHELTEIAADALGLVDPRHAIARDRADRKRLRRLGLARRVRVRRTFFFARPDEHALVRAVVARGHAELAADAGLGIDARDDLVVEIEVAPLDVALRGFSAKLG